MFCIIKADGFPELKAVSISCFGVFVCMCSFTELPSSLVRIESPNGDSKVRSFPSRSSAVTDYELSEKPPNLQSRYGYLWQEQGFVAAACHLFGEESFYLAASIMCPDTNEYDEQSECSRIYYA
ncbi:MAG: hypothetical protein CM1200mP15_19790 [Dehalococcoidia bacterium]|nr:MAG: hypothetical protein CM1200mP15_19790 [Dehalococcoidia bacterium]